MPMAAFAELAMPPAGFEPATVGLEVRCSIQLSYGGEPTLGSDPPHSDRCATASSWASWMALSWHVHEIEKRPRGPERVRPQR
jgi:hypothetical protein